MLWLSTRETSSTNLSKESGNLLFGGGSRRILRETPLERPSGRTGSPNGRSLIERLVQRFGGASARRPSGLKAGREDTADFGPPQQVPRYPLARIPREGRGFGQSFLGVSPRSDPMCSVRRCRRVLFVLDVATGIVCVSRGASLWCRWVRVSEGESGARSWFLRVLGRCDLFSAFPFL